MMRSVLITAAGLLAAGCGTSVDPEPIEEAQQAVDSCGSYNQPPCGSSVSTNPAPHNGCNYHLYLSPQGTCKQCGAGCTIYWCSQFGTSSPPCPYPVSSNPAPHNGCNTGSFASGNMCRICGDYNEYACPYTYAPYVRNGCKNGWTNNGGICQSCGHDNEAACPYTVNSFPAPHNQCFGSSINVNGVCHTCGGAGQPACPYVVSYNQAPDQYCNQDVVNVNGTCVAGPVVNTIGHGQMGRRDGGHRDVCGSGLTPQNVDSRYSNYPPAPSGWFSCWWNSPDVNCYSVPKIANYIWVRRCYQPPNGGPTVNYGCNTCP